MGSKHSSTANAIILLSGGLDSTVVLALALSQGKTCYSLSFDYNQRHFIELEAAEAIAKYYNIDHQIIKIDPKPFSQSSLVGLTAAPPKNRTLQQITEAGIPNTYVPARNSIFLSYAMAFAELFHAEEIHLGANKMDITGYPDCRPGYIDAFQGLLNVATEQALKGKPTRLIAPLIEMNKDEIFQLGLNLNAPIELTISCYQPIEKKPCLECDACVLRTHTFPR